MNTKKVKKFIDQNQTTILYIAHFLIASAFVELIKSQSFQLRPDQSDYKSFPSGHSDWAMALAAVYFLMRDPLDNKEQLSRNKVFVAGSLLALIVMAERVLAHKHFIGDTIAGAAFRLMVAMFFGQLRNTIIATMGKTEGLTTPLVPTSSQDLSLSPAPAPPATPTQAPVLLGDILTQTLAMCMIGVSNPERAALLTYFIPLAMNISLKLINNKLEKKPVFKNTLDKTPLTHVDELFNILTGKSTMSLGGKAAVLAHYSVMIALIVMNAVNTPFSMRANTTTSIEEAVYSNTQGIKAFDLTSWGVDALIDVAGLCYSIWHDKQRHPEPESAKLPQCLPLVGICTR